MIQHVASAGRLIIKAYLNHLLWFTIGCVAGAIEAFTILAAMWGPR